MKGEYVGRFESKKIKIQVSRRIFIRAKKKFGKDKELVKVAELKKTEQGGKTIEEFVQEFRKVTRKSRYKKRALVEEFKRGMNGVKKLIETERSPTSIEQQYKHTTNLDRYQRKIKKKKER